METDVDPNASFTEEVTVVLKNDPRVLPMVCGICGSQFSTGRGLEVHLRTHKIDRRKKPTRKPAAGARSRAPNSTTEITTLSKGGSTVDESGLRKSMRTPKRKAADEQYVYIYEVNADGELLSDEALSGAGSNGAVRLATVEDEEEEAGGGEGDADWGPKSGGGAAAGGKPRDDGGGGGGPGRRPATSSAGSTSAAKEALAAALLLRQQAAAQAPLAAVAVRRQVLVLPEYTKDGVPIARLDDYIKVDPTLRVHEQSVSAATATAASDGQSGDSAPDVATDAGPTVPKHGGVAEDVAGELQEDGSALQTEAAAGGHSELPASGSDRLVEEALRAVVVSAGSGSVLPTEEMEIAFGQHEVSPEEEVDNGADQSGSQHVEKACEVCLKVLLSNEMRQHMIDAHVTPKDFTCRYEGCSQSFTDIGSLRAHMVVHGIGSAGCAVCQEVLPDASSLRAHMRLVHGDDDVDGAAEEDAAEDGGAAAGEQACEYCNKVFKNRRAHSSHMKKHTKPLEPSECDRCGRTFRHKTALKFHQKMNADCDKSKYVCELCGYKGTSPWRLASHRSQVHSTERPYLCEMCPKTFKTREMMKLHMHKMHTGVPQLDCNVCSRKFFYKAELREHMQIHSEVKSFECPICHRAFKTMHVLRGHLSGKHSDTWYTCCFCKFTTSHKKSMKRHMVLVHKLTDVTLEVKPEDQRGIQLEVIPSGEGDVQLHIPDGSIQYDDQLDAMVTTTVISEDGSGTVAGGSIDSMVTGGECIVTTTIGNASNNPAVEVSEVLVALSSISESCVHSGSTAGR